VTPSPESTGAEPRCGSRFFLAALILVALAVGGLLCALGAVAQRAFGHDTFILLDGAWRVLQGQRPQVDFHTTLGPVTFMILSLGMRIVGPTAGGLGCANGLLFIVIALWAWSLSRARMSPGLSFLSALCAAFTAAGVSCYGYGYLHIPYTGYAAIYNRYGEAFTALIVIEALWPLRPGAGPRHALLGGFSSGAALVILFFLKLNFFGMAVIGIVAGALLVPYRRSRWTGLLLGLAVAGALMLAYLRFDFRAIGFDVVMSAHARLERTRSEWPRILHAFLFTVAQIYLLLVLWAVAPAPASGSRGWLGPKWVQALKLAYLVLAQLAFHWSNGQLFSSTLLAWGALLILSGRNAPAPAPSGDSPPAPRRGWGPAWLVAVVPIGLVLASNFASLGYATLYRVVSARKVPPQHRFASESMSSLLGFAPDEVAEINDGLELLRRHSGAQDRILAFSYNNPFSFALRRPSPTGDSVWWDDNGSYAPSFHPDPVKVFANVEVVLMPRQEVPGSATQRMLKTYGAELARQFQRVAETERWLLYRRNPADAAPAPPPGA
jgi:hypothetical protein